MTAPSPIAPSARTRPPLARRHGKGGVPGAVEAEWVKLWTVRTSWWTVLGALLVMGLVALQLALNTVRLNDDGSHGPGAVPVTQPALEALIWVQLVVAAIGMGMASQEYATGSIRSTLQAVPVRYHLFAAKAIVVSVVSFGLGLLVMAAGAAVSMPALGAWGETDVWPIAVDVLGGAAYLALASLATLGVATVLRSAVGTLTTMFLALVVMPMVVGTGGDGAAQLLGALPGGASLNFLTDTAEALGPGLSLVVFAAWAAAALLTGAITLQRRDA